MTTATAETWTNFSTLMNPHPRQREFFSALNTHTYLLYGGAAGGGKSYLLRWALLRLLLKWGEKHQGVRVGLFSQDYPTLHDRQLSKIRMEFPEELGTFHEAAREFHLHPDFGGGVICFRNLDDPSKYKSAEFAAIAVEELTELGEDVFDLLRFRLRWPGIGDTKFLAATNPTGIGMYWVKKLWIERDFPVNLKPFAHQFIYVRALSTDNPHNHPDYADKLDSLPPDLRAALRDGSWDVFEGQVFGEFRREVHVCEPFAIPDWWNKWGSNDPGFSDPGVWYLQATDQDGTVYIYDELTFQKTQYSEQAKAVAQRLEKHGHEVAYWVTGMDAFNAHPETGKTLVDYYQQGGLGGFRKPVHGPGARKAMAATFHEYLKPVPREKGGVTSRLKIFSSCKQLVSTLPTLPRDENKPEQVAECPIDHWYQAAGYGLQSRHMPDTDPLPVKDIPGTIGAIAGHAEAFHPTPKLPDPFAKGRR